jgi:hypothetical protein
MLVAGTLEVDQRQQERLRAGFAQGADQRGGTIRAARHKNPGAFKDPGLSRLHRAVPSHGLLLAPVIGKLQDL